MTADSTAPGSFWDSGLSSFLDGFGVQIVYDPVTHRPKIVGLAPKTDTSTDTPGKSKEPPAAPPAPPDLTWLIVAIIAILVLAYVALR